MWSLFLCISICCLLISIAVYIVANIFSSGKKIKIRLLHCMLAGIFAATLVMFFPVHYYDFNWDWLRAVFLSLFNSMQVFALGCEFDVVKDVVAVQGIGSGLNTAYLVWASALFFLAPVFTFGFVLSLFKNLSAYIKYLLAFNKDVCIFSELNDKSLVLAGDIKSKKKKSVIVFTNICDNNEESIYDAESLGAICFKKDALSVNFKKHSARKPISFFAIGNDETDNLNLTLRFIESYKNRDNTHVYVFSTKIEGELLLTDIDKGKVKVRRINQVSRLINSILYEQGNMLFETALPASDGKKKISAVVVGMGNYGTEMVKALTWFCQMDGYKVEINAFSKNPLAGEKFTAIAPELMSDIYNGTEIEGEAQYKITVHSGIDVETISFANEISKITDATYVIVALGDDETNINTAVMLRMYFERMKLRPKIQAIVYNSRHKKALEGIKNFKGQEYGIEFIGDMESTYTWDVIINSELEEKALKRHLKWGNEDEFWTYEYNYRSSLASLIHMKARMKCAIPGADKKEEELTEQERNIIEVLEHKRWNAYVRSEGYVFSGSKDKSSRNDLAKMHNDLVDFSSLSEEEKRKDSQVGVI